MNYIIYMTRHRGWCCTWYIWWTTSERRDGHCRWYCTWFRWWCIRWDPCPFSDADGVNICMMVLYLVLMMNHLRGGIWWGIRWRCTLTFWWMEARHRGLWPSPTPLTQSPHTITLLPSDVTPLLKPPTQQGHLQTFTQQEQHRSCRLLSTNSVVCELWWREMRARMTDIRLIVVCGGGRWGWGWQALDWLSSAVVSVGGPRNQT